MYHGHALRIRPLEEGLVELCFDRQDSDINKLDTATVEEFRDATGILARSAAAGEVLGVLVTSGKPSFIVGADIFEFQALFSKSAVEIAEFNAHQSAAFTSFEDLPVPTLAAINGLALGGGFELALAADFRVLADDAQVGLPEVSLGLFPGFGGTVRLPRRIGAAAALDWIVSGTPRKSPDALACGAADAVAASAELRAISIALLRSAAHGSTWRDARARRLGPVRDWDPNSIDAIRTGAARNAARYPAALSAVELIEACISLERDDALLRESTAFGRIARTPTAQALIQLFINEQAVKKRSRTCAQAGVRVQRAAVLGAGIMGGGIAYTSASRGIRTVMKDIRQEGLDAGLREADRLLSRQVSAGRMPAERAAQIRSRIDATLDSGRLVDVDLVIEAVVEDLTVKRSVLVDVEKTVPHTTVVASNTSSLSIDDMAGSLSRPELFGGMHFFNPVPQMPLVEIIRGRRTSDATVSTLVSYALALGKTPVVLRDCPGFLVNRILNAYYVGFCKLIRDGADFEQVDAVMERFGWPMGPAYLQDVIGMDTSSHVFELIAAGYPGRQTLDFASPMRRLVATGRLGQKNGRGFYQYERGAAGRLEKRSDDEARQIVAALQENGPRSFTADAIVDRLMIPTILEAMSCLEEGIVESAAEIDMAVVLGLGFPRHLCGVLAYAESVGLQSIVRKCAALSELGGGYQPSELFKDLAVAGRGIYPQ